MNLQKFTALMAAGVMFLSASPVHSQQPKPTPEQQLKKLKEDNQKLLETQQATLEKLDEMLKEAQQLRGFAHRT